MYTQIKSAEQLGKALASAAGAMTNKDETNITSAMLLRTENEQLAITVANVSSHQLKLSVPATIHLPGGALLPGDYFAKIVNRLGDHPVALQLQNNRLTATASTNDTHEFNLFQGDPDDFPLDTDIPPVAAIVDGDGLHEALKAVLNAATENEQEITFSGRDSSLGIYASHYLTTRSRFAVIELNFDFSFGIPKNVLVGGKMPQWTGPVQIHVNADSSKVVFSKGNEHLLIRRVFAQTDVETMDAILSTQPIGRMVLNLRQLRDRVHTIAIGKQVCVLKVVGKTDKNVQLNAENAGIGGSRMVIPVQGEVIGTTCELRLDVALLEKALKSIDGDDLLVDFVDYVGDGKSISLRFANDDNPEKRQTLMVSLQ